MVENLITDTYLVFNILFNREGSRRNPQLDQSSTFFRPGLVRVGAFNIFHRRWRFDVYVFCTLLRNQATLIAWMNSIMGGSPT